MKRDKNIILHIKKEISLNSRIVKSKKLYDKKKQKQILKNAIYNRDL